MQVHDSEVLHSAGNHDNQASSLVTARTKPNRIAVAAKVEGSFQKTLLRILVLSFSCDSVMVCSSFASVVNSKATLLTTVALGAPCAFLTFSSLVVWSFSSPVDLGG